MGRPELAVQPADGPALTGPGRTESSFSSRLSDYEDDGYTRRYEWYEKAEEIERKLTEEECNQ